MSEEKLMRRDTTADRLRGYLTVAEQQIPGVWKTIDWMRNGRGNGLPNWPSWCFMPLAVPAVVVGQWQPSPSGRPPGIAELGALAAWRATQGIYHYDETLQDALWTTQVSDIPEEVLMKMPEGCVYVETPGRLLEEGGKPLLGFFAFLEYDAVDHTPELRLLTDDGDRPNDCTPIHLGGGLVQGIERAMRYAEKAVARMPEGKFKDFIVAERQQHPFDPARMAEYLSPMVSTLLYLCTANAEMRDSSERRLRPSRATETKTKDGPRIIPPDGPTIWEVGLRIGPPLRASREVSE